MKKKFFLTVSIGLIFLLQARAQLNNNSGNPSKDSMKINAFAQLVSYISTDTLDLKLAEREKNAISHLGEEHSLYTPLARGAAREATENSSWDKSIPIVYHKEATQGSPFLLFSYVPGLVVNDSYKIVNKHDYLYNYDKMTGNLLLIRNNEAPIAVNREQVKLFCLKIDRGGYIFMRVPLINDNEFFQVIYRGPKYSSYKLYKNSFVNANQKTNGYITEGKDYDEYLDIETFYMVDERKEQWSIFELTKKSIKKTFNSEPNVLDRYFKDHKYEDITESYVVHLLESLNK